MKRSLVVLSFCFLLLQPIVADDESEELKECLQDNGLPTNIYKEVGKGEFEKLKDVPESKIACVIACSFNKRIRSNDFLFTSFVKAVNKDKSLGEDTKKEMLETINRCSKEAKGDNCKFLDCLKITKPPFVNLIITPKDANDKKM
ncbi:hypothetical protein TSAR_011145 [Trichomalopsis sarcophagae]|uniref:Uncharacterized protein n=1 Tax=Trichomalopsis sarcophagae TaxID=543379 RepID=A0A232FGX6_9HYME|nr:hypothetical protein TSAR_011145 [Trichomalopsis sarcophagae]